MVEEQQEALAINDATSSLISLDPAQMDQFYAAIAFFDQLKNLIQNPNASTPPASSSTGDTQAPPAENILPLSKPATAALKVSKSQRNKSSSKATSTPSNKSQGSSSKVKDTKASSTAVDILSNETQGSSSTAADSSSRATQGFSSTATSTSSNASQSSSLKPQANKLPKTRYEYARSDTGEKSIRRYRKRPAPSDPAKDPRLICHKAAHNVCSKIIQVLGFKGEW